MEMRNASENKLNQLDERKKRSKISKRTSDTNAEKGICLRVRRVGKLCKHDP